MGKVIYYLKFNSIYDWQCISFGLAVLFLPFHVIQQSLSIPIMGDMGGKLSIYPIVIGLGLFVYQCQRQREIFIPKKCIIFFVILLIWQLISLVHGLYIFPAWPEVSADKFNKLNYLLSHLSDKGIVINMLTIGHVWWSIKLIVRQILIYCITYGAVIWIIALFYQNREKPFKAFRYGVLVSAIICSLYSIVEFMYLFGSYDAMAILAHINPIIYDVGTGHGWWPPLLGGNRVRSMFAEPAFMALYLTVAIPFVFAQIYTVKTKKWFWKLLFIMLLFMMWGTNSKTAMGILLAEGLATVVFLYLRRKHLSFKQICWPLIALMILCGVGTGLNWIFQHRYSVDYDLVSLESDNTITLKITNKSDTVWEERTGITLTSAWFTKDWRDEYGRVNIPLDTTLLPHQSSIVTFNLPEPISREDYPNVIMELAANNTFQNDVRLVGQGSSNFSLRWDQDHWLDKGESRVKDNKMTALTSTTAGSNQQRYGLMYVETLIGLDHLFFGVGGNELKQAYIISYIPEWLMKNKEVQLWVSYQETKGLLKAHFPILSDYSHQFASYGLPGFVLFLLPSFYGLFLLLKKRAYWLKASYQEYSQIAILGVSYFGLMVAFVGCNSLELYIYWLLLGVLLGYYGTLGSKDRS